jgi:hypothetical protein
VDDENSFSANEARGSFPFACKSNNSNIYIFPIILLTALLGQHYNATRSI